MDHEDGSPLKAEDLHLLSYSALKKVARESGIKQRCKSEKLIELILSQNAEGEEVFSTPAAKELNSSRKNKEKVLDEIQTTPLETPRRGTYSLESASSSVKRDEDVSPVLPNVTLSRGSERKLRPRKVSFVSPAATPQRTPRSQTGQKVKNRPKTPVASRKSSEGGVVFDFSFTTLPQVKLTRLEEDSMSESSGKIVVHPCTPPARDVAPSSVVKFSGQPGSVLKNVESSGASRSFCKEPTSSKRGMTPNFRRIHQRAFDKMESIDDYQKRKLMNSAKKLAQPVRDLKSTFNNAAKNKKIPGCSGIPFIPSTKHSSNTTHKFKAEKFPAAKENTPRFAAKNKVAKIVTPALSTGKSRLLSKVKNSSATKKFDLKASLSRKLGYKPYTGALKPLGESGNNCSRSSSFHAAAKEQPAVNKVVKEKRAQNRSIIRGVRTNKRFELQMRNRKMD